MEFIKLSNTEIKVIDVKTENVEHTYNLNFLLEQKKTIQAQKDRDNAQRDKELAEVDALIAKCKELGIVEKIMEIEPIVKSGEFDRETRDHVIPISKGGNNY